VLCVPCADIDNNVVFIKYAVIGQSAAHYTAVQLQRRSKSWFPFLYILVVVFVKPTSSLPSQTKGKGLNES